MSLPLHGFCIHADGRLCDGSARRGRRRWRSAVRANHAGAIDSIALRTPQGVTGRAGVSLLHLSRINGCCDPIHSARRLARGKR